jgi:transcriptional repressor of dcmA and dcmR
MEKLLSIKEAATFLNVSEMSLRRWTNAGKLKCFRLGGKNERRFTRLDLENFLRTNEQSVPPVPRVPLGIGDTTVKDASHIAHFYKDVDESIEVGVRFVSQGLARGEAILIVSPDSRAARIIADIHQLGYPVDTLINDGTMVTSAGFHTLREHLKFITETIARCPPEKGFRLLGDMTWAVEKGWSLDEIHRLEVGSNHALNTKKKLFLCQYDLHHFGADGAMMAFDTHSLTVYRGEVQQSPYFQGAAL